MPAPTKGQLEPIVKALATAEGLQGENAPDMASAIAETVAGALDKLASMALVSPGIAAPPGATAAPGRLQ